MCPACLTTVALIAAGASSTDGITALIMRTLRHKGDGEANDLPCPCDDDEHETTAEIQR